MLFRSGPEVAPEEALDSGPSRPYLLASEEPTAASAPGAARVPQERARRRAASPASGEGLDWESRASRPPAFRPPDRGPSGWGWPP